MGAVDFATFHNVINGKLTTTDHKRRGINPATREPNPEVPLSTPTDVDSAVEAGQIAFKSWSKTPWVERKKALLAFADALESYQEQFRKLLVQEQGKPMWLAIIEVEYGIRFLRTTADLELKEEIVEDNEERKMLVRYTALGVAIGIVPWNFPFHLSLMKLAPAVLTGNTIILKPSPFTPYCNLKIGEIAQQVLPPGVVQVLSGDESLGPWLTAHPGPAKISFTGSSATGKKIMESASKTLKRVTLELGGNDPAIICADVDIETVAPQVAMKAFFNSGQVCVAVKRLFVHESIYENFRDAIVRATQAFKVGDGNEPGVVLGPIQNSMQFERVKGFIADIEQEKWNLALGGKVDTSKPGYFVEPTIIDNPPMDSRIVTEEPFGPIVPMVSWKNEAAVIKSANDTKMGLGASVWSNDPKQARRIADQLESGLVWINTHEESSFLAPFGGHKESGIGYEGGIGGLKSYCNAQTLVVRKKPQQPIM
ncbi:hypothetical protein LOZ61_001588 [Ophidiomyces ophidiicola]|nr:hypothetical protein LOZ61_001588 [Ophidiomyces ophidiicola]KAI1929834.1 hypothetical protein LOZ60_001301 [Ophidiomyces ophidiicola]KAI1963067.1 hypothetical protein LOZ59_001848 [Ophidiomyces ophidiicola]KAI2145357.1 hypothetical protein LOZ27_003280 [Ophidiomyces ophidiicola]KAI2240659.1 hypothetical protein LOZ13_002965 [Ophidiomyces ophidiicola]